jgi:hypothetical protein
MFQLIFFSYEGIFELFSYFISEHGYHKLDSVKFSFYELFFNVF